MTNKELCMVNLYLMICIAQSNPSGILYITMHALIVGKKPHGPKTIWIDQIKIGKGGGDWFRWPKINKSCKANRKEQKQI